MNATTVHRLRRDVGLLREQVRPPRPALSPVEVATRAGFGDLDRWQRDILAGTDPQVLMLCSRQSGKSTVATLLAAHEAAYVAGSLTLILSPTLRQSVELGRRVRHALAALGDAAPPATGNSMQATELANGSRVLSLPGGREDTIRVYSGVGLLILDEASRVGDPIYGAARPMVAVSQGRVVALSTPFGCRGWFWREWSEGGAEWRRTKISAYDCPRIPRDWLEKEKDRLGLWLWEQEYMVEFKEAEDAFFRFDDVAAAFVPGVAPLFPAEGVADAVPA